MARGWIAEWQSALAELSDNPLNLHLSIARKRAQKRISALRRLLLPLVILIGYSLLFAMVIFGAVGFGGGASYDEYLQFAVFYALGLGSLYWMVLLCQGVFDLVADCIGLLSRRSRSARHLCLDESLASAHISDKEILVGALSIIALPLLRRVFGGSLIFAAIVVVTVSEGLTRFDSTDFWRALVVLPFSIAGISLAGTLALLGLCFVFISFGLNQRSTMLSSSAGAIHAGAQFFYPLVALPVLLNGAGGSVYNQFEPLNISMQLAALLVLAGCHLLFIWAVLALSARSSQSAAFWAIAVPFFLPLLIAIFIVFEESFAMSISEYVSMQSIWAWGSLALANPLASLGAHAFGAHQFGWDDAASGLLLELLRVGVFFLLQISVLTLCAVYAERAVRRWRQAGE